MGVGELVVLPADGVVGGLESPLDHVWMVLQDLLIKIAPDQLVEPHLGAARARAQAIPGQLGELADRQRAKAQMCREIARAFNGGVITGAVVAVDAL